MSGMRPTGKLHLGHLEGALRQWVAYCDTTAAFFETADLHAFRTADHDPPTIRDRPTLLLTE